MAIDLIEDNELAALSESRLGGSGFIDDDNYSNLLGIAAGAGLLNRTRKEKKQLFEAQVRQQNAELDNKYLLTSKDNCDTIQKKLTAIGFEIELTITNDIGKNKNDLGKRKLAKLREIETSLKIKYSDLDCLKKQLESEKEKEKKENLDVFNTLTNTPPAIATDEEGKKSNTNKYIIYGVGGIILLTGIILLLKNK
jgi:hypothetical protein